MGLTMSASAGEARGRKHELFEFAGNSPTWKDQFEKTVHLLPEFGPMVHL